VTARMIALAAGKAGNTSIAMMETEIAILS
jgi:hypothetical protein